MTNRPSRPPRLQGQLPITPDVADLYANIFHPGTFELEAYDEAPDLKAA